MPLAVTVNVTDCPTHLAWLAGCCVMDGATHDDETSTWKVYICDWVGELDS